MVKNVLDFEEFVKETSLNEGLIMTYPADKVVKYIQRKYNLDDESVELYIDDGEYILVNKKLDKSLFDSVESVLKLGGYYQADENIDDYYTYEKIYEENIFDKLKQSGEIQYFYHLTPSINDKKIQTMGLIPRSRNYRFKYPDRIYLLSNSNPEFLHNMCVTLYQPIYLKMINLVFRKEIKREILDKKRIKEYSVYRIDFSKVENIKLYRDPNVRGFDSYFTMDNIRPEWIEKIDEIKL